MCQEKRNESGSVYWAVSCELQDERSHSALLPNCWESNCWQNDLRGVRSIDRHGKVQVTCVSCHGEGWRNSKKVHVEVWHVGGWCENF